MVTTTGVSSSSVQNSGRSPEADLIYKQYVDYYNDINAKITAIDRLPSSQANLTARSQLISLQQQLYPLYTSHYNNSASSLATFQNACYPIETQVFQIYNQTTGSTSAPAQPSPITVISNGSSGSSSNGSTGSSTGSTGSTSGTSSTGGTGGTSSSSTGSTTTTGSTTGSTSTGSSTATTSTSSTGRSAEASQIYSQYLTYYNDINTKISAIDQLPYNQRILPSVSQDRTQLTSLQQQLYALYTSNYNNSQATLNSFIAACANVENAVLQTYNHAIGTTTSSSTTTGGSTGSSGSSTSTTGTSGSTGTSSSTGTTGTTGTTGSTTGTGSTSSTGSTTGTTGTTGTSGTTGTGSTTGTSGTTPTTPVTPVTPGTSPAAGKVENGTWYITWTSWNFPIPQGVNSVNIFVGNMHLDAAGKPVVDGFGTMSNPPSQVALMDQFIQQCRAKGISVQFSLGGGGGSYDNCWDVLTPGNVQGFAKALADLCTTHGANGIDFDVENFTSPTDRPAQQALCGTLIKNFKQLNPNFQATLCTNAGFGPYFPWPGIVQNIMDAANYTDPTTNKTVCGVDRLYIMSYFNSLSDEQGWITAWADWTKTRYNFTPAQISVGINSDAHAYDVPTFAAWAASKGYSTTYWPYDPGATAKSDQQTTSILSAYTQAKVA